MRRVVLTREPPRNDALREALSPTATVVEVPATFTELFTDSDVLKAFDELQVQPATVVVTSARSAHALAAVLTSVTSSPHIVAIGPATTRALEHAGIHGVVMSPEATASALGTMALEAPVLSIGAAEPRPELALALAAQGLGVHHLAAYRTVARSLSDDERQWVHEADVIVVAAPSAWRVLESSVRPETLVLVPGETTASAVRAAHENVIVAATTEEIQRVLG